MNKIPELTDSLLNEYAMKMIVAAGEAINILRSITKDIEADTLSIQSARNALEEANGHLIEAHGVQTEVIQQAIQQNAHHGTILFNHAQDTLMVTKSELNIVKLLLSILEKKGGF